MRVYNFSAGPSCLPEEVLKKAADEMLDQGGSGMSVMEMSHRSKAFDKIIKTAEQNFRELMNIPDNYKVLFLQGGGSTQFAMIPLNLMNGSKKAGYVLTGQWASKACKEASKFGDAVAVASSKDKTFSYIPKISAQEIEPDFDYFYICENNTIYGTKWHQLPETGNVPLVADLSSCILSEPTDVKKYGLIFAGAQKNLGPAGLTVVIIREDLIGRAREGTPTMLDYATHAENDSLYNTPPCYSIYFCGLVLEWIKQNGGPEGMKKRNLEKADMFYSYLESSPMFSSPVAKEDRSLMNIPFVTGNEELDKKFVADAAAAGFVNLKGHRTVGGMRASIYNAMPVEGVAALIEFMKKFEANNK